MCIYTEDFTHHDAVRHDIADKEVVHGGTHAKTSRNGTLKDGAGLWVSTDDFLAPHARKQILHVLPNADTLRYQFGEHSVVLHPEHGDPDRLLVEIS